MKRCVTVNLILLLSAAFCVAADEARPNILFFFVDDWGRNASIYADPKRPSLDDVIKTPNFDRVAREGVLFNNAFVHVSSCGPSRASLTTGQYFWNCGSGAFLNAAVSTWNERSNPFSAMPKFPDLLRESGYYARRSVKTIAFTPSPAGPGEKDVPESEYQRYGLHVSGAKDDAERARRRAETLLHPRYEMRRVLEGRSAGQPFFFIYGTINVHRPYQADSGQRLWGIQPDALKGMIPKFLPDVKDVRRDFADYLGEVQAADAMLGVMLEELEFAGELDRTIVILSGDNGIPGIPRGKTNCYDLAVRAPLMVRWPEKIKAGRQVEDFVSLTDIGPTLLELAGLPVPGVMNGRSFARQLLRPESGWIDPTRDWVLVGRELHFPFARDGNLPYPMRAIRTKDHLYIRNFKPDRWPNGAPYNIEDPSLTGDYERLAESPYRDLDSSLTKAWILARRAEADTGKFVELTLGKRPPEELYAVNEDPDSLNNLANDTASARLKKDLAERLMAALEQSHDPRLSDAFDRLPYVDPHKVGTSAKKGKEKTER